MKIFEVAGEGKLHGLTVMSLDAFVGKEDDVEESDISGIMHAAKNYNKSFLITAELAEGGKKTFRVRAQSERAARDKFEQHHNQATIISVKEEGITEDVESKGPWLNNKTNKWVAWYKKDSKSDPIIISADSEQEARTQLEVALDKIQSQQTSKTGITPGRHLHKQEVTSVGFNSAFVSGVLRMSGQTFFAQFNDGKLLISATPAPGFRKVSKVEPSPTGTFSKNDIQNAGLNLSQRYDITPIGRADSGILIFKLSHHSDVSHANDRLHRQTPSLTIQLAGRNLTQEDLSEAPGDFGLGANYRAIPDEEMQDLMGRSKNKTKTKRDKFDYPYIHGSNIEVKDEAGKKFDTEKLKAAIMVRPKSILGQNDKMQHSENDLEAVYDIGLPALKGLAVNEKTGQFVVVDTCPGAGACQTYCYAMKGSYVMFKAVSMGLARMLNFLLNDPEGFASKLNQEIAAAKAKLAKLNARMTVRWHDAGDFFSPEYLDMAYKVAQENPDVSFYAYTKMGDVANAARPKNFNMNFSQGAKTGQEKKVNLVRTKHSKVVPREMFAGKLVKDESKEKLNQFGANSWKWKTPADLDRFKADLANRFQIDKNSIITYTQMMGMPVGAEPKWNVIVAPGDGDQSANRSDVIGTYLLFH